MDYITPTYRHIFVQPTTLQYVPSPTLPASGDFALTVTDLVKTYGARDVVDHLSFQAMRGELTAVLGPNGAGKTTSIECCEGLREPTSGTIEVLGLAPGSAVLRERVGVMLQDGGLPTGVKAVEMLRHIASMYRNPRPVDALVDRLGIGSFARTTVRRLSGGQRQRLALAASVIGRPELVFLDEPSAGMDPQSRHAVWELIQELRAEGVSFVLTTHLMDEAEALADAVVIVDAGKVIASGTVHELTATAASSSMKFTTKSPLNVQILQNSLPDELRITELSPKKYLATQASTPAALSALTAGCAAQDVLIEYLATQSRSLEDVFLDLTGRNLR